jgi:hypothetical protein
MLKVAHTLAGALLLSFFAPRRRLQPRSPRPIVGSIATGNRWGGPHANSREIARRQRQARARAA